MNKKGYTMKEFKLSRHLILYMRRVKKNNKRHGFSWSDEYEDDNIHKNGVIVCWFAGRSIKAQMLVEALTYETGSKVDFSISCGRIHVDTLPENVYKCREFIYNDKWMKKFIQPYEMDFCRKYTEEEQRIVNKKNEYYLNFI